MNCSALSTLWNASKVCLPEFLGRIHDALRDHRHRSEMLGPDRLDTNSLKLTAALYRSPPVVRKSVVGDRSPIWWTRSARARDRATSSSPPAASARPGRSDARGAGSQALGPADGVDASINRRLEGASPRRLEDARGQQETGERVRRADTLANERGTAPGFHIEHGGNTLGFFRACRTSWNG